MSPEQRFQCVRRLSDPDSGFVRCVRAAVWKYEPDPAWSHPPDVPTAYLCQKHDMRRTPNGYLRRAVS